MKKKQDKYLLHITLFLLTLVTTTLCGAEWINAYNIFFDGVSFRWMPLRDILKGFHYSVPFMTFLLFHEFGHYFTARYHSVRSSLPYCIPFYIPFMQHFGSMGAVIRMKERVNSNLKYFDIGIAGPLAGFVVGIIILTYGFINLPSLAYIFNIHPEYRFFHGFPAEEYYSSIPVPSLKLGKSLLIVLFEKFGVQNNILLPNGYEMPHYPYLFAGWLAMFFTALNLFPVGQLDGGHILYGLFGRKIHYVVSRILFTAMILFGGTGIINFQTTSVSFAVNTGFYMLYLYLMMRVVFGKENYLMIVLSSIAILAQQILLPFLFKDIDGYTPYLFFAFILGYFLGIDHPETQEDCRLSLGRKILGWMALVIFVLCFCPKPFVMNLPR